MQTNFFFEDRDVKAEIRYDKVAKRYLVVCLIKDTNRTAEYQYAENRHAVRRMMAFINDEYQFCDTTLIAPYDDSDI